VGAFHWLWNHVRAVFNELVCLPLMGGNNLESILFISPMVDLRDPVSPPQGAGLIVLSMGDGILAYLSCRSPDPTLCYKYVRLVFHCGETSNKR
jgi:hypothetical protein